MDICFLAERPQYIYQIAQWYFEEWASKSPDATVENVAKAVAKKSESTHEFPLAFIAHNVGTLIGVAELKFHENKSYPEYEHWLGGVFVPPEHRGSGVARQLIISAQRHVLMLGLQTLYLQCESHNVALYRKYDFTVLHEDNTGSVPVTIMVWKTNEHAR